MSIQYKIIGLPVYTQSGTFLGEVVDFEMSDSNQITKYFVKSKNPIKNLLQGRLEISANQVISIDDKKMVVEDTFKKIKEPELRPSITQFIFIYF